MNIELSETCRICKREKAYTASEYPLKNGVACAECSDKASEYFHIYYDNYANARPTPGQMKDNIAFMRQNKKRFETFSPKADSAKYTADTLILVDYQHRMIAFFPTDCSEKRISADIERFEREKNCEIFMFEDLKDANLLNSVNSDERFIMIGLKAAAPGYPSVILTQRAVDGSENSDMDELSQLLGLVLQSRRQK